MCVCVIAGYVHRIKLTFHALTLGSGASTNLMAPSADVAVAFALFLAAFESSAAALTASVAGKFDLLEVTLLSPAHICIVKTSNKNHRN